MAIAIGEWPWLDSNQHTPDAIKTGTLPLSYKAIRAVRDKLAALLLV